MPQRSKAELKQVLANHNIQVEDEDYLWEVRKRGYEIEEDHGTLGGYNLTGFLPPEGRSLGGTITKEPDGSDEEDHGRSHAALRLLVEIIEQEQKQGLS